MFIKLALILSATVASAHASVQLLFPEPNRQYIYFIKANVSSTTLAPKRSGSYWTLEGKLYVRAFDNFTRLRLQLSDLKKSVSGYNNIITEDSYIKEPWDLDYMEGGLIKTISVGQEPVWCTNLKRALSVNFQLKKGKGTYYRDEPCLDSVCMMIYTPKGNKIQKFTSYRLPTTKSSRSWSSLSGDYSGKPSVDTINTAERLYVVDDRKGLLSLDLQGSYEFRTHDHILAVNSELSINYDNDIPGKSVEKLNLTEYTVTYVATDFCDPTNGIRNVTQSFLKNHTQELLLKIARGIDADNIVRDPSLIHNLDFIELLNTIAQLNYTTIIKLFEDLVLGTSYDMETSRNIFLEALPHARSEACARFIKYLVIEEKDKIEDAALLSLIRKLPFNVATFDQSLLEELEAFTKLGPDFTAEIRHAGILSFASLLHKTIEFSLIKQDYIDNVVVKYFRMYSDCPQYLDRMVWLQGLCNIGYSAEGYLRIIYADSGRDRHERLWAAVAIDPKHEEAFKVLESTLSILTNQSEHIQLRIASLHMFLTSQQIRENDFIFVHNYISTCNNNQLKRFWYTTVKNLMTSKSFTDYRVASYYVPFIVNQVSNPDPLYLLTNNYIISGEEDVGSPSLQVISVGDTLGVIPPFIAAKLNTGGRRPYKVAVYLIIEGVTTTFYKKVLKSLSSTQVLNVEKLLLVLKNMKAWTLKTPEKVHIDIVIKTHDKTIFATHLNQSRIDSVNIQDLAYIEDFLRFGSHINQQMVYYPFQSDIHVPSELGTPIRLQSLIVSFTSIRGNLTAPSSNDMTWRNDLHIRYQGTSVTSLSTDGPLIQTAHRARIQQSMVAHLPMKFNVSFSGSDGSLQLTWPNPMSQQGGVAMHSRVQVAMESVSKKYNYTVTVGDSSSGAVNQTHGIFFDCDRPVTDAELLNRLLTYKDNNYDFLTSVQPSHLILNTILLFTFPPSGSCGLILSPQKVTSSTNDVLQAKIQARYRTEDDGVVRGDCKFQLTYFSLENPKDVFLNMEAITNMEQNSVGNTDVLVSVRGHQPNAKNDSTKDWTLCLRKKDVDHTSSQDISAFPASYEGHVTLTYGLNHTKCFEKSSTSELMLKYKGVPQHHQGKLERYFEINVYGKNISEIGLLNSDVIKQTALGQLLRSYSKEVFNITIIIKERDGLASLSVNRGAEIQFKSDNFAWLLDGWTGMQVVRTIGLYRECRIKENEIKTLSGTTEDLPSIDCQETLALADCSDNSPRFAVIRYIDGIKVFSGGYSVSVKKNQSEIYVDDTYAGNDFWISAKSKTKITSKMTALKVYYDLNETVILVPLMYLNNVCGLCTEPLEYNVC